MSVDWEARFRSWSKPPSDTEDEKCNNAERMVKDALHGNSTLSKMNIRVFAQGSYRHNTNVRLASDVDICACLMDCFFYELPDNVQPSDYGITPAFLTYIEFKKLVEDALVTKFGRNGVTRGNKAFDVHANTYRVDRYPIK